MIPYATGRVEGLTLNGQYISNAVPIVTGLYTAPDEEEISIVEVTVWVGTLPPKTIYTPPANLDFATLQNHFPAMDCARNRRIFNSYLKALYVCALEDYHNGTPKVKIGIFASQNGILQLPDGTLGAVEGCETIGLENHSVIIDPALEKLKVLSNIVVNAATWLPLLLAFPNAALIVLAFILASMVRSAVLNAGVDLQAVLYVTGLQGIGKTTLVRRFVSFITRVGSPQKPATIFYLSGWAGISSTIYRTETFVHESTIQPAEY